jgi:hypothetical protein
MPEKITRGREVGAEVLACEVDADAVEAVDSARGPAARQKSARRAAMDDDRSADAMVMCRSGGLQRSLSFIRVEKKPKKRPCPAPTSEVEE